MTSQGVETVVYAFRGLPDAGLPFAGLVRDAQGNLYGTTASGGTLNLGAVFKVTKAGKERVLHSFSGAPNGAMPRAPLILDSVGNLYRTTADGGTGNCNGGCGTVFMLSPSGAETVLHSFAGGSDGEFPAAGLVRDSDGNLYGTTMYGGGCASYSSGCGTVFMLRNTGVEVVLHSFAGYPADGTVPGGGLIIGSGGNLYGTTESGGTFGFGTVFELTRTGTEKLLYSFGGFANDGLAPTAGLVGDRDGTFYGTTWTSGGSGCSAGCGTIFRVTKAGFETVMYSFPSDGTRGSRPSAGLIRDAAGNLYGTTANGGTSGGSGVVFELTP